MTIEKKYPAHPNLTSGGQTSLHSHTGGGNGADVKSGSLIPSAKTWTLVTFNTPFSLTPVVTGAMSKNANWSLRNVSITGFEVYLNTTGNNTFWWIATDAGNP